MDIKEKIEKLKREMRRSSPKPQNRSETAQRLRILLREETVKRKKIENLEELSVYLGGKVCENKYGSYIVKEELLENAFHSENIERVNVLAKENFFKMYNLPNNVFLDLETSGLCGGTGTFAFLIGIGYLEDNKFKIKQFFLPDLPGEKAMLLELASILNKFKYITTFNGKSFDLPLLTTRYRLCMLQEPEFDLHLDLLHVARRIYKRSFDDRSLSSLEEKLLGTPRIGDIAGHLIPEVYFNFLRTNEVTLLTKVIEHNVIDVFSMLKLLSHFVILLEEMNTIKDADVLFSISRIFIELRDNDTSINLMKRALRYTDDIPLVFEIKRDLSRIYKRMSLWKKAEQLWIELLSETPSEPFPYIELAKFYEHIQKEHQKAYAILKLCKENLGNEWEFCTSDDLIKREQRLKRKIEKEDNCS